MAVIKRNNNFTRNVPYVKIVSKTVIFNYVKIENSYWIIQCFRRIHGTVGYAGKLKCFEILLLLYIPVDTLQDGVFENVYMGTRIRDEKNDGWFHQTLSL